MTQSGHCWSLEHVLIMLTGRQNFNLLLHLSNNNDKAKPAEKRGRKATGLRFLREATDDSPKDPKIAGLPKRMLQRYCLNTPITDTRVAATFDYTGELL